MVKFRWLDRVFQPYSSGIIFIRFMVALFTQKRKNIKNICMHLQKYQISLIFQQQELLATYHKFV